MSAQTRKWWNPLTWDTSRDYKMQMVEQDEVKRMHGRRMNVEDGWNYQHGVARALTLGVDDLGNIMNGPDTVSNCVRWIL